MEKYRYKIGQHWLNYIFNSDVTGLTEEEVDLFDSWWDVSTEGKQAYISLEDEIISDNFGYCDVSNIFCSVVDIDVVFIK